MGIFQRAGYEIADTVTGGKLDGAIEMGLDDLYANASIQVEQNAKKMGLGEDDVHKTQVALGVLTQDILPGVLKNHGISLAKGAADGDVETKAMEVLLKEYPEIKDDLQAKLKEQGIELDGKQLALLKQSLVSGGEETANDLDSVSSEVDLEGAVLGGGAKGPSGPGGMG